MMPTKALVGLLQRAIEARDGMGAAAVAERLLLYSAVVSALEQFTGRELSRVATSRKIKHLAKGLSTRLRNIEIAQSEKGPAAEHVRSYYECIIELQTALTELDKATESITITETFK